MLREELTDKRGVQPAAIIISAVHVSSRNHLFNLTIAMAIQARTQRCRRQMKKNEKEEEES